jgi:hypothetical protein
VHVEHSVPLGRGEFDKRHLFTDTGVTKENIDPAQFTLGFRHRRLDFLQTPYVNLKRERPASQGRDFLRCRFDASKVHITECDVRSPLG